MILGIDTSTYLEELNNGATYYSSKGNKVDPLDAFKLNGVDYMRIRLWVDPYNGRHPYLGGTCDLDNFLSLSKIVKKKGYKIILDFHYSDFWCDPSKQFVPKSWKDLDYEGLKKKVYEYTVSTLKTIRKNDIPLYGIQIGNEITNGFLWPIGKLLDQGEGKERTNYPHFISLLKEGIKGAREIYPESKIIIHLERSADHKVYEEFFSKLKQENVDYDIIGASYYPYYHGKVEDVMSNLSSLKKEFNKLVMIMEVGYAFTTKDYIKGKDDDKQLVLNDEFIKTHYVPYKITPEGQYEFIKDLIIRSKKNGIDGIFYWEPLWIPGKNICWTSKEGQDYINEKDKSTRNEWANQALYDYDGNGLIGLDAFKKENE